MENSNYLVQNDSTFLSIIDSLPNALIITNPDLSIRYVNPAFIQLTGFALAEVKGKQAPYPWWPKVHHQAYLAELSVVKQGKKHKSDWLFVSKEGNEFWIKASVAPVIRDGKVLYLLACWTDITANKAAETALQKQLDALKSSGAA
jgi:PAS domain S-box-containing protein